MKRDNKEQRREDAWAAHQGLLITESRDPTLRNNPFWTMIKQDAYERFAIELAGISL